MINIVEIVRNIIIGICELITKKDFKKGFTLSVRRGILIERSCGWVWWCALHKFSQTSTAGQPAGATWASHTLRGTSRRWPGKTRARARHWCTTLKAGPNLPRGQNGQALSANSGIVSQQTAVRQPRLALQGIARDTSAHHWTCLCRESVNQGALRGVGKAAWSGAAQPCQGQDDLPATPLPWRTRLDERVTQGVLRGLG